MKEVRVCELPLIKDVPEGGLDIRFKATILAVLPYVEDSDFAQVLVDDGIDNFYIQVLINRNTEVTLAELVELKGEEVYFQGYLMAQSEDVRNAFVCIEKE